MSKSGIATREQFERMTNVVFSRRSNPLIKDLDHLLELYHKPTLTVVQELKILATICIWCMEYLKGDGSRKTGVDQLLSQANILIDSPKYEYALSDRNEGFRDGSRSGPQIKGKSLEPYYKAESILPGKGSVAGLKLETKVKRFNVPAYRDEAEELLANEASLVRGSPRPYMAMIGADQDFVTQKGWKAAEMLIEQLSLSEQLKLLSKAMSFDSKKGVQDRSAHFEYCTSDERKQYRVFISKGGLFYKDEKEKAPFDTGKRHAIYALDTYGVLYVKFEDQMKKGSFNHSSFMRGKPVTCAGNIVIQGGYLKMIDNGSGHYRPTAKDLVNAIKLLHYERGVSMLDVKCRRCDLPKLPTGDYPEESAWSMVFGVG